jgi:two-component system LytT family response regulator
MHHHPSSGPIRALLVDDEMIALRNLRSLLEKNCSADIEICGMTASTAEAELMIRTLKPQVLFLDIQLRSENAFQFLERIKPITCEVIFVTAYDQYALQALKLSALDYILKPICTDELQLAVSKLRQRIHTNAATAYPVPSAPEALSVSSDRMILKNSTDMRVVLLKDLFYIEAKRSYCLFYYRDDRGAPGSMLISKPLSDYADILPADLFCRIHKSYIVNYSFISRFCINGGQHSVKLTDGTALPLSRRKYNTLQEQFRSGVK